jgi:hypothetical protein
MTRGIHSTVQSLAGAEPYATGDSVAVRILAGNARHDQVNRQRATGFQIQFSTALHPATGQSVSQASLGQNAGALHAAAAVRIAAAVAKTTTVALHQAVAKSEAIGFGATVAQTFFGDARHVSSTVQLAQGAPTEISSAIHQPTSLSLAAATRGVLASGQNSGSAQRVAAGQSGSFGTARHVVSGASVASSVGQQLTVGATYSASTWRAAATRVVASDALHFQTSQHTASNTAQAIGAALVPASSQQTAGAFKAVIGVARTVGGALQVGGAEPLVLATAVTVGTAVSVASGVVNYRWTAGQPGTSTDRILVGAGYNRVGVISVHGGYKRVGLISR